MATRLIDELRTLQLLTPVSSENVPPAVQASLNDLTRAHVAEGYCTLWTCNYLHPETGACEIYEHRPTMCRSFPDNDIEGLENGHNRLCHCCSSTYCKYHPETPK